MAVVEIERRVILFKSTTTMPDDSQLGWNADPNTVVNGNSDGETLLYNSPLGTQYIEDDGTHWRKTATPNTWIETDGTGGGSGTGAGVIESQDTSGCTVGYVVYLSGNKTWTDTTGTSTEAEFALRVMVPA